MSGGGRWLIFLSVGPRLDYSGYAEECSSYHYRNGFLMVGNDIFKTVFFLKFRQKMDSRIHQKSLMTSLPLWCKISLPLIYLRGLKDWRSSPASWALTLLIIGCVTIACCACKIPTTRATGTYLGSAGNKDRWEGPLLPNPVQIPLLNTLADSDSLFYTPTPTSKL